MIYNKISAFDEIGVISNCPLFYVIDIGFGIGYIHYTYTHIFGILSARKHKSPIKYYENIHT